jgi:hypothetical protein
MSCSGSLEHSASDARGQPAFSSLGSDEPPGDGRHTSATACGLGKRTNRSSTSGPPPRAPNGSRRSPRAPRRSRPSAANCSPVITTGARDVCGPKPSRARRLWGSVGLRPLRLDGPQRPAQGNRGCCRGSEQLRVGEHVTSAWGQAAVEVWALTRSTSAAAASTSAWSLALSSVRA